MNNISKILSTFKRDIGDGGTIKEIFHRKFAHSFYLHNQELNSIKKYWSKGRVLNVGAGRDCGKLGGNVISGDLREGVDEYTKIAGWKDPIKPDYKFDANKRFPFESENFDCVMSMHLLEHMENLKYTLLEMLRITKWGGVVCGVLPCTSGNPYYNYWRDQTHLFAYSRHDFLHTVLGFLSEIQVIQFDTMNKTLNPFSFDFVIRKGKSRELAYDKK